MAQLGCAESTAQAPWEPFRILSSDQIRRMSRDGLVRFGAHTASHQILTRTAPDDARQEIERSVAAVAGLVDDPSHSFAYPNGGPDDFDNEAKHAVHRAGMRYAVSVIGGPVSPHSDPYALPRYLIGDDSPARFAGLIHHARDTARKLAERTRLA